MKRTPLLFFLAVISLLCSCNSKDTEPIIKDWDAYLTEHQEWQKSRLEKLKSEKGWLNLAGLYWLKEGSNSFGSGPGNDIRFPIKADLYCGVINLDQGEVRLKLAEKVEMFHGDSLIRDMKLTHDLEKGTTHIRQGDLSWYIIKRGDRYGIRLRDLQHPRMQQLDSIPSYPASADYVVEASLELFESPDTVEVATPVEDYTERYACPGKLHFKIGENELELLPFSVGKGYFLVISDQSTGLETYGAGRFMYVIPDSSGRIILDFNRATNPPCAFSPFATCPMPPRENLLPISIDAGEKSIHLD